MLTHLRSPDAAARWLKAWTTGALRSDSRKVRSGDAFIAWPGYANDGRRFVAAALQAGAATCLVEAEGVEPYGFVDARIGALPGLKAATGPIAEAYYGQPSQALHVIAVTGTNGKTSTAWWTAQALTALGRRCGVVGTLGIGEPPAAVVAGVASVATPPGATGIEFTGLTTPDPVTLHAALRGMADAGFAACAIEASSIGIDEHRLAGVSIEVALFTNFSRDHLDYHGSMDAYWAAKQRLFGWPGLEAAVVNVDDARGAALAEQLRGEGGPDLWTYAVEAAVARVGAGPARLQARGLRYIDGGLAFTLRERGGGEAEIRSTLIGDYNAANLLAVIGGLRALGVPLADAARVVSGLTAVPGRMQRVVPPGAAADAGRQGSAGAHAQDDGPPRTHDAALPEVVVDYAHTPDALEKVLAALRPLATARGGRLHCVFGCGGNRDATKRPVMGAVAERLADAVTITSDNPRDEPPQDILRAIVSGLANPAAARVVEDRRAAIAQAVADADARDVLLVAGKGHEDYQEIAGTRRAFSDVIEAERALALRRARSEEGRR